MAQHDEFSDISYTRTNAGPNQYNRHNGPMVGTGHVMQAISPISGTVGPEKAGGAGTIEMIGKYDYEDHEMDNPGKLNPEEEKHRGDVRFEQDLGFFGKRFQSVEAAFDTYCELGYKFKIQFKLYEQKMRDGKVIMFSLICSQRGQPRFLPRFFGGTYTKISQCGVNIRFVWNPATEFYERLENGWKITHDHRLELDERCQLPLETMTSIKRWWMDDP